MEYILSRTSVRQYTDQSISKEDIETILKAGFSAPSAHNLQPWEFIVVQNKETLEKMSQVSPYGHMLAQASMGMVICINKEEETIDIEHGIMDASAATENMLIAANHLGIGSCWIGGYPLEDRVQAMKDLFQLPEHILPLWMISFGYPATPNTVKDKWKESKIHYECY